MPAKYTVFNKFQLPTAEIAPKISLIRASELITEPYKLLNTQGVTFRFNHAALTVEMLDNHGNWFYEVDLERCTDSAHLLDALLQIASKRVLLFSAAVVGDLICVLEETTGEVFGANLQGLYCPGGRSKQVDWTRGQGR